jgi:hypothetical protein
MNVRPNVPDWQHKENLKAAEAFRKEGYRIEVSSQGYQVWSPTKYLSGCATIKKPHGRYAEANRRDYLACALATIACSAATGK